jgi:hypothetical protein
MICEFYLTNVPSVAEAKASASIVFKVPHPASSPRLPSYDRRFFKYYTLATSAILFYDYFLTLADEVCAHFPPNSFTPLQLRPRFIEGQIRLVREEIVECVHAYVDDIRF